MGDYNSQIGQFMKFIIEEKAVETKFDYLTTFLLRYCSYTDIEPHNEFHTFVKLITHVKSENQKGKKTFLIFVWYAAL